MCVLHKTLDQAIFVPVELGLLTFTHIRHLAYLRDTTDTINFTAYI